jgi:DNA polymerase III subunit beta
VKFQVDRDLIAEAAVWVGRVIPQRPAQPILRGIHIIAADNQLIISGSDLDVRNQEIISANVIEPGEVLISGRLLSDIMRALPAAPIDVASDGTRIEITSGRSSFTLQTMPTAEYPPALVIPAASGTVNSKDFTTAISQIGVAAARDDFRQHLTGINFIVEGNDIELAATDGNRLAVAKLNWSPTSTKISTTALVPAKYIVDIAKTLSPTDEITLSFAQGNEGLIGITAGNRQTISRTIASTFPTYKSLLDFEPTSTVQIDTAKLIETVKRVSLVLDHNSPIALSFEDGETCVFGAGGIGERSEAREYLESTLTGESLTLGFFPNFLIEGLSSLNGAITEISLTAPMKPALLVGKPEIDSAASEAHKYLLLPRRLD